MPYSAYVLTQEGRAQLLSRCPPKHPEVIAHHVTYSFPDKAPPPSVQEARVVGYAGDERLECVVVELDGARDRPSGGTFHVTLSLNRALGAKPVHSNKLLKKGWAPLEEPFVVEVSPELLH